MKTIFNETTSIYEIEKSKFIGIVFHCESIEEFKNSLNKYKKEYPKATHYCYAYYIGKLNKNNDDGEPSGTAGAPINEVILRNNLVNVGLIVIRYFGGIKLGAGGLIRAYAKTANDVINISKISSIIKTKSYKLMYDYSFHNLISSYLSKIDNKDININFNEKVERTIATNEDISKLKDICNGKIEISSLDEVDIIKDF